MVKKIKAAFKSWRQLRRNRRALPVQMTQFRADRGHTF